MKALTLWQPWASLVAVGAKAYETRSWDTPYRGELVIHAAQRSIEKELSTCLLPHFKQALHEWFGFEILGDVYRLPHGAGLAVVELVDIFPTEKVRDQLSESELAFGNYADGRFAWELELIHQFDDPVPQRGFQKLWDWPE